MEIRIYLQIRRLLWLHDIMANPSKVVGRAAALLARSSRQSLAKRACPLSPLLGSNAISQAASQDDRKRERSYIQKRPFSATAAARKVQRPVSAGPVPTSLTPDHEKDNEDLRSLFDAPPSSSSANNLRSSGPSTGLFEIPSLTSPQSFLVLAQQTLARAQLLVDRIDRAGLSTLAPWRGQRSSKRSFETSIVSAICSAV